MNLENLTPAMKQYLQMKQQNPDCILLFRIGDFYEVFFEDAKICASVLDLIITSKNKNSENPIPMAGIPHHSIEKYIPRLIAKGYKVAIAEQMTDPVPWKIVERSIKSIITPGTYIQENQRELSTLLAITRSSEKSGTNYHLAWWDFTIGNYQTKTLSNLEQAQKLILSLRPTEIILDSDLTNKEEIIGPIQSYLNCLVSVYGVPFDPEHTILTVCKVQQLASFGKALTEWRASALALLFAYIQHTQQQVLKNVNTISYHAADGLVLMDETTVKNLEIFSSSYENSSKYTLFEILNTTKTAWGARLLRDILSNPTNNKTELNWRLSHLERLFDDTKTSAIHQFFSAFFDIPKLLSLILYRKLNYIPFIKLRTTLWLALEGLDGEILTQLKTIGLEQSEVEELREIYNYLLALLKADDQLIGDSDYIADWRDPQIDELRKLAYHSDDLLLSYQQKLVASSGITNIKLKFITNQWYFLELTSKDSELFDQWISEKLSSSLSEQEKNEFWILRRQTLKWNQRYSSPLLENLQWEIISSREQLRAKEQALLQEAKSFLEKKVHVLAVVAEKIAWVDLLTSYALLAKEQHYTRPQLLDQEIIVIQWGRHPVIEAFLPKDQPFIPNDLKIGKQPNLPSDDGIIHIITWPNMGGKSTYLRQSALIVLLAHCGLFVPAQKAEIWLVDGIFARVGSWDIIAKNQSTFMTEMIEVANILNNATKKSFIIFDELGRGTSTYDGLALTKAILHYILQTLQAKTLIATHYHELIALEQESPLIKNFSVSVYETDKQVIFMKKITHGWANKSYGIDVAKLAGIPSSILAEARENLAALEKDQKDQENQTSSFASSVQGLFSLPKEKFLDKAQYEKIKSMLNGIDLNNITPLQALQLLVKIKEEL